MQAATTVPLQGRCRNLIATESSAGVDNSSLIALQASTLITSVTDQIFPICESYYGKIILFRLYQCILASYGEGIGSPAGLLTCYSTG